MTRDFNRNDETFRPIAFNTSFTRYAEGSVLACFGHTKVLCNTSIQEGVPKFLRDKHQGWLTAEYQMLPRSTHTRSDRESTRQRPNGRSMEIQRLIGRCLRSCLNFKKIPDFTLLVDCDVIQADGGTRTTAINGSMIALIHAIQSLQYTKKLLDDPVNHLITAFSFGVKNNRILLDLDYDEDSHIDTDCTLVMTDKQEIIEIQASAEKRPLTARQLTDIIDLAHKKQPELLSRMREAINHTHAFSSEIAR